MAQADPTAVGAVLRALAGASSALRLYPVTSHIPAEAIGRFVELSEEATKSLDFIRVTVEPKYFTWGEYAIGRDNAQMEALAATLYSHQVGQLVIAAGLRPVEAQEFVSCISRDKAEIKDAGGITKALVDSGVTHLAVVEMTVRSSREEGLKGVDLLAAPLDEIGREVVSATERWAGGETEDEAEEALSELAAATREIAASRITDAMLRLDEPTRLRVLANARRRDASGRPMEGMLRIIGQMGAAALSRLLTLVARESGEDARALLPELDLPPEALQLMTMMLSPSPQTEEQRGVPPVPDIPGIAAALAAPSDAEEIDLERMIATADPALAAGRGLVTACSVTLSHPNPDSVQAVGEALPAAVRAGAFAQVDDALRMLEEYEQRPELTDAVARARRSLADPGLIADACEVVDEHIPPEALATIISAAGDVGCDVFVGCWSSSSAAKREHLRPVVSRVGDRLVVAAGKVARGGGAHAREAVALLGELGDSRAIPQLGQIAKDDDRAIRLAAVSALADIGGADAARTLGDVLSSRDEETRTAAAHEIGRAGAREALPALMGVVEKHHLLERDAAFKLEVMKSIVALDATEAIPVLKRLVARRWVLGAANKTVRSAARSAIDTLDSRQAQ